MIGITSYGAYIPRLRLNRKAILQTVGWFAPGVAALAQGERSMCNWDEDTVTMAVAAAKDCLSGIDKTKIDACYLASTTFPFADRLNAGIVSTALNLRDDILAVDFASSQKAATSALVTALGVLRGNASLDFLVCAADKRDARAGSRFEMLFGDGAAALLLGSENVIAEFEDSHSISVDFVDHYRAAQCQYDYLWEERWIREEGYVKIIPAAVDGLLSKMGLTLNQVDKLVYPCPKKGDHSAIARTIGIDAEKVVDNLFQVCGETGAAHPLVMLVSALETSKPGDRIIVASFGQGCDALSFRVSERIRTLPSRNGIRGALANKKAADNYAKYQRFRDLMVTETGIRAEGPNQTALTTLWRDRKTILGLIGGKCPRCGTAQFPKVAVCVNPKCGAIAAQEDYEFADEHAIVRSFTGDMLTACADPPAIYGMVQFERGGRFMADFTDTELADLKVGMPVIMTFRRHNIDRNRGFTGYFWKAVLQTDGTASLPKSRA